MAAKKSITYDNVMAGLKKQEYLPIYLLKGDEPYFIDRIADYIAQNVLDEVEQDFNQQVVYGADCSAVQIADMARALPMMAQRRVVVVREAQTIKNWEPLADYLANPAPDTLLVLCCKDKPGTSTGKKTGWTKVQKLAEEKGICFDSKKRYEKDIPPFIEQYLAQHDVTIEHEATQLIADHIGTDLTRITSELDKVIATLTEDNRNITMQMATENIGVNREYNVFELRKAIVQHNVLQANRIWKYFENNDPSRHFMILIPTLFAYFETLFIAHFAPDKRNLQASLGLKAPWQVYEYSDGMRHYNAKKTLNIIHKLHDTAARGNGIDNRSATHGDLMRELLFYIMH